MSFKKLNVSASYFDLLGVAEPVPNFRFFKFFLWESLIVFQRILQSFTKNDKDQYYQTMFTVLMYVFINFSDF